MTQSERSARSTESSARRSAIEPGNGAVWIAAGWLLPGIVLVGLYVSALDFDFAWTDTDAIAGHSLIRPPEAIGAAFREPLHRIAGRGAAVTQSYYRPLQVVLLSWIDARFGTEPRPFRVAGLAVGVLALGLFASFARQLGAAAWAALVASLVVAAHPVGIETYVWIAGGSGALCALFAIGALAAALAAVRRESRLHAVLFGAASLVALLAALLSKERAVVEPLLLLATFAAIVLARRRREPPHQGIDRRRAAGLLALHVALVCSYFFAWRPQILGAARVPLPLLGGDLFTQWASAVANWPGRLAWLFVPIHSSTSDVIRVVDGAADLRLWLGVLVVLGSVVAFVVSLRLGRPLAAIGIAWIWIAYAPTANLLPQLHANGERYWFLSAFGAGLLAADLAQALLRRAGPTAVAITVLAALLFLGQRTAARLPDWRSNLGLFESEIQRDAAYREAYFLVAHDHFTHGRLADAASALAPLLRDDPVFDGTASYQNPLSVAELACSLAVVQRRYEDVFVLEAQLQRRNPAVLRAPSLRTCIGQASNARGDTRRAVELFRGVAAELGPATPPALPVMIARAHLRLREFDEARVWLERARAAARGDAALQRTIRDLERELPRRTGRDPATPGDAGAAAVRR